MRRLVFFDLDGTIARHDTFTPYVARRLSRRPWRVGSLIGALPALLPFAVGRGDRGALKGAVVHAVLGGATQAQIERWNERFLPNLLARGLFEGARDAIAAHRRSGDHLVLMSASVDLYVPEIGRRLGFDEVVCSVVAWRGERLDGRLATPNRRGEEKARCFREIAARHVGLGTVAYGNARSDLPHMRLATRAVMVNPDAGLRAVCDAAGIEVARW